MANEAYRAVFLRVHPTGKMVLSLTTEPDGKEPAYAQLVARELGVPALDVKVVPADTDRFGVGHGYNTSPSDGAPAAITSATAKILAKAQLLAGMALGTAPESLAWVNGAWVDGDGRRPDPGQDDRGHRALRARDRRAAARRRGRARRPGRLQRLRQAGVDLDAHLVGDLQRAEERRVRLHAPVALLDDGGGAERFRPRRCRGRTRAAASCPLSVSSPSTVSVPSRPVAPVERKVMAWRLSTSSSMVCWMFALSSSPRDCMPPVPSRTRSDAASAASSMLVSAGSSPTASVASQAVTWIRRSWPALAAAPVRPVCTERVPSSGPSLYVPGLEAHAPTLRDP